MKKEMTNAELIKAISVKVKIVKPFIRGPFLRSLRYKTKPELQRILKRVKADSDGYGIDLR